MMNSREYYQKNPIKDRKFNKWDIQEMIKLHKMWLNKEEGGVKLELCQKDLQELNFSNADLRNATFDWCDLKNANFENSNLENANFEDSYLSYVSFKNANLTNANLKSTRLVLTDLTNTNLTNANLDGANFGYITSSQISQIQKYNSKFKKVLSIDAETNGLWGKAFAIGVVLYENEREIKTFVGRCPIEEPVNEWVAENVLPQIKLIPVNYNSYKAMLEAFVDFYMQHKRDADIIVHMGLPVEAKLFLDAHKYGYLGDWAAPYPLIDISAIKEIGTSVDTYNEKNGIKVPADNGGTHNLLYDCRAAALAYHHIIHNKE